MSDTKYGRLVLGMAAVCGTASAALAGGVRIVERPSVPPFVTIQGAVDAAFDGETLLVGQGTYPAFEVTGKGVSVVGEGSGLVTISGTVTVADVPGGSTVLLSGLKMTGASQTYNYRPPGLELEDDSGHVRVQNCTITGGLNYYTGDAISGPGVEIEDCPSVAFVGCTISGASHLGYCAGCPGDAGGNGITATNGGVALYDCTLKGGRGTDESAPGGDGGHAYFADSWGVTISGCTLTGGSGGGGDYVACYTAGDGGDGLRIVNAQAHVLDSTCIGGLAATFGCGPAATNGQAINNQGGFVKMLSGSKRPLSAPPIADDLGPLTATITAQQGDRLFAFVARQPYFLYLNAYNGTWLVPFTGFMKFVPIAVASSTGPMNVPIRMPDVHAPQVAQRVYVQFLAIDALGKSFLSSPQHVLLLDHNAAPDCNGNGVFDLIDTAAGLGSVTDTDNDFIPDVCGGPPTTHWVEALASAGGDGSSASPFQNIRTAMNVSLSGHVVMVRDGVYAGPLNRDLDFAGRAITVKSENGAANCVIDCSGAGRAFVIPNPGTVLPHIQGFTIRNGFAAYGGAAIDASYVAVWDCTIENCAVQSGPGSQGTGGAIRATQLDVRRCTFRGNSAGESNSSSFGGAISIQQFSASPKESLVHACTFENNQATRGGAVYVTGSGKINVTHCRFPSNQAWLGGGALFGQFSSSWQFAFGVDDCLFVGNQAISYGGAMVVDGGLGLGPWGSLAMTNSTFADNHCTAGYGGALSIQRPVPATIANCVFWNDTASQTGPELSLRLGNPTVSVSWCDVKGGLAAVDWSAGTLTWGAGNLDVDPAFADPDGADNDPLTYADNDYSLALASPCIDAGDNSGIARDFSDIDGDANVTEPVPLELALQARRVDVGSVPDTGNGSAPIVDMGAFEKP